MTNMIMYTGDLLPDLEITLSSADGVSADDADSVRVLGRRDGELVFDRAPSSIDQAGSASKVTMQWEPADTAEPGLIEVEVEVTWPGAKPQTFRANTYVEIREDFDHI